VIKMGILDEIEKKREEIEKALQNAGVDRSMLSKMANFSLDPLAPPPTTAPYATQFIPPHLQEQPEISQAALEMLDSVSGMQGQRDLQGLVNIPRNTRSAASQHIIQGILGMV
jgi:hypothetical protein